MDRKNFKKAFTYVELIVAISIISLLMLVAIQIFKISIKVQNESSKQFEIQADVTYSGNTFSETVRDATAIFLLNQNKFNRSLATESNISSSIDKLRMTKGWNYIALNSEKTKIYNFIWDKDSNTHIPFLLTLPEKGDAGNIVEYAVSFSHKQADIQKKIDQFKNKAFLTAADQDELKKLNIELENSRSSIDFSIKGKVTNNNYSLSSKNDEKNVYTVNSTVYAQNTRQVIDISDGQEVTAIAYRTTDLATQATRYQKPAIALVLDFSGSMAAGLDGYKITDPNKLGESRIEYLKKEYKTIIDKLTSQGDFDLYVVPFSSQAFHDHHLISPSDKQSVMGKLPFKIERNATDSQAYKDATSYLTNFKVYGWTNYGDAVRMGIEYLRNSNAPSTYLLVLSDGAPTALNYKGSYWETETQGDGYYHTSKGGLTEDDCTEFIDHVLRDHKSNYSNYSPNLAYLVGFSSKSSDNARLEQIESYFQSRMKMPDEKVKVVKAKDQYQLSDAFDGFVADINADLWYFDGP